MEMKINKIRRIDINLQDKYAKEEFVKQLDIDTKVFISSIKDAAYCTKQIFEINSNRIFLEKYIKRFKSVFENKEILLLKTKNYEKLFQSSNDNKNLEDNKINDKFNFSLVKGKSLESIYAFSLYKESFDFYSKYIHILEKNEDFHTLYGSLEMIEKNNKMELENLLYLAKMKYKEL